MQMNRGARNVGVDAARAVALGGMFVAHLTYPSGVLAEVVYGFPSALFAFVAGISMAFMSAGGAGPTHFVVRGLVLVALGASLALVPTDIVIVLGTLGICMIGLSWAPRWVASAPLWQVAVFATLLTVASGLTWVYASFDYPPLMWAELMVGGMGFHRVLLGNPARLVRAAVSGLALMALDIFARWYAAVPLFMDVTGHTGGVLDVVGSVGASVGICAACCLLVRPWQVVLPRMGRMPLSLYCLHVLSATYVGLWVTLGAAAVLAVAWLQWFPRGPVEEGVRRVVGAGAGLLETIVGGNDEEDRSINPGSRLVHGATGVGDGELYVRR